jgi:hypothetical protein
VCEDLETLHFTVIDIGLTNSDGSIRRRCLPRRPQGTYIYHVLCMHSCSRLGGALSWQNGTLLPTAVAYCPRELASAPPPFKLHFRAIKPARSKVSSRSITGFPPSMGSPQRFRIKSDENVDYNIPLVPPPSHVSLDLSSVGGGVQSQDIRTGQAVSSANGWDNCANTSELQGTVRVLTWNTLADGLAQHGDFEKVGHRSSIV